MLTAGFRDANALTDHFDRHHAALGIATEAEYSTRADAFLGGVKRADQLECVSATGDTLRFVLATQEYGVLAPGGHIRTYHVRQGSPRDTRWFHRKCKNT